MWKMITDWWCRPANWYHFWRPSSGPTGGWIFAVLIVGLMTVIHWLSA